MFLPAIIYAVTNNPNENYASPTNILCIWPFWGLSVFNKRHFQCDRFVLKNVVPTRHSYSRRSNVRDQTLRRSSSLEIYCFRRDALQTLTELHNLTQSFIVTIHTTAREYVVNTICGPIDFCFCGVIYDLYWPDKIR